MRNSNKYFRDQPLDYPLLSLSGYLKFWAVAFLLVTAWLLFAKKEVRMRGRILSPRSLS